jgi:O-antigen/teichoic acid export membrane protein
VLAISSGLPSIVWLATSLQPMAGQVRGAARDFVSNWSFSRWALASHLLASTTPYVMPWVVAAAHGEAETGMLGACSTLVGLSNSLLMGLCNFLTPRAARAFAEGGLHELQAILAKTALLFSTTLGLFTIAAFVLGEQIAVLVYGPEFAGAGPIVGILSLGVLANSIGAMAGNGLWAMERPSANFVADAASLVVVVVATIFLVPAWGPLGAAVATLAGMTTDSTIRLFILWRTMVEHASQEVAA